MLGDGMQSTTAVQETPREATRGKLTGACNRCGDCCRPFGFRCFNLIERGDKTTCAVYANRYDMMPIMLMDKDGNIRGKSFCRVGAADDAAVIEAMTERDLSRCSLEVQDG